MPGQGKVHLLVGVLSSAQRRHHRDAIRATWGQDRRLFRSQPWLLQGLQILACAILCSGSCAKPCPGSTWLHAKFPAFASSPSSFAWVHSSHVS